MLKVIGMILIIFSTSFIGHLKSSTYKNRLFELNEFKKGVEMFETEVKFVKSPLREAFDKIGRNLTGAISEMFIGFSEQYGFFSGKTVSEIWNKIVDEKSKIGFLDKEDIVVIKDFGICLGTTDTEGQINNILSVLDRIEYQIKAADEALQKNAKLYQSLGIYSGVLISILLI